jgi:outer membrane protein
MNGFSKFTSLMPVLAAVACGAAGVARAADLSAAPAPMMKKAPVVEAWNPWMLRVRALGVLPDASGSRVSVTGVPALSSPNSGLSISDSVVPELDISYFFTQNIAAELILGVTRHSVAPDRSTVSMSARPGCCRRRSPCSTTSPISVLSSPISVPA